MKIHHCINISILIVLLISPTFAEPGIDIDKLINETDPHQQEILIEEIVKAKPDWQDVSTKLQSIAFEPAEQTGVILQKTICIDGVERQWVLYVPEKYDSAKPTPLFVWLHGGVSRAKVVEKPLDYLDEHEFRELAKKMGWFMIYPMGQIGATWWDEVGIANIRNLIRMVKTEFNINNDKVWMGGFSDGASASFLHAMVDPTDYAAFLALNGHMGVGSSAGGIHTYAPNMYNTPIYAVTSDKDGLYPSKKMRPSINMAIAAGADIFYRELEGQHDFSYAETELPLIRRFLDNHPRNPFPIRIVWETAERKFGRCHWLAIDKITTEPTEDWHVEHNLAMVDNRIRIGFVSGEGENVKGVVVNRVTDSDCLANRAGLLAGDIIIKGGSMAIQNSDDLSQFKKTLKRGDTVELTVKRGEEQLALKGSLPEVKNYLLFERNKPSAMAIAEYASNRFDIKTSAVGALRILIHPAMINFNQNVKVIVNNKIVYNDKVLPDIGFMLRNFLANYDNSLLYVAEIKIELDQKLK